MPLLRRFFLILFGVATMAWTIYLMSSPIKYALGFLLLLAVFVSGELLLGGQKRQAPTDVNVDEQSLSKRFLVSDGIVIIGLAFSLAAIYFVPAIEEKLYMPWADLGLANFARVIAAFAMNFLPGYLILSLFGKRAPVSGLAKLLAAYFISFFMLSILGFVAAYIEGAISRFFIEMLVSVGVVLIGIRITQALYGHYRSKSMENHVAVKLSKPIAVYAVTLLLLAVVFKYLWFVGLFEKIGFFIGGPGSDMWRHHGFTQSFLDGRAFVWLHIPWWFYVYLASSVALSGAPSVNSLLALYPLVSLSILSFYVMVSTFLEDKRMASIATFGYTAFSGFAWIYALSQRGFAPNPDPASWTSILYQTGSKFLFEGWYPPFPVGFTPAEVAYIGLWLTVFAVRRLNMRSLFGVFLVSVVSAMIYLTHGVDFIVFVIFLAALLTTYVITRNDIGKSRVRWASISLILGLFMAAVIDLSLTKLYGQPIFQYVYSRTTYYYFNSPSFQLAAVSTGAVLILSFVKGKPITRGHSLGKKGFPAYPLVIASIAIYTLAFALCIVNLPSFATAGADLYRSPYLGSVPWYIYTGVGGVPFIFALGAACYLVLRRKTMESSLRDAVAFSCFAIMLLYLLGITVSFINERFFYTGFWERRILAYLFPLASITVSFAATKLLTRISSTGTPLSARTDSPSLSIKAKLSLHFRNAGKLATASFLLSLIFVGSISSTLIAQDFFFSTSVSPPITGAQLDALTFLHYDIPSGARVAYLDNRIGGDYIRAFANDKWTYDARQLWGRSLLNIIASLSQLGVEYIYHDRLQDAEELARNPFMQQLLGVLPIVFSNTEVTIYSIRDLRMPTARSSLSLISLDETEGASYDAYALWLFALMKGQSAYSVVSSNINEQSLNSSQTIILTYDPLSFEDISATLINWISNGGNLIVSNTNPYGFSADYFGIMSKTVVANCDSPENWKTAYYKRGQISVETADRVEGSASLRLQNNLSSWEEWIYTPSTPLDISTCEYLGISVYGNGGGPYWRLYLTDSNGAEAFYRYDLSELDYKTRTYTPRFTGWQQLLIPVKDYFGGLDLSSVKKLRIVTGYMLPVNILIDDIFVLRETGEGRQAVLTNGIQDSTTTELPEIEVADFSWSSEARILANYTMNGVSTAPLVLERQLGSGKITYINADLLYQSITNERGKFAAPHEILAKILEFSAAGST